jgi:hypothetical protein
VWREATTRRRDRTLEGDCGVGLVGVGFRSADWINMAQDTYRWRAYVNTVTNLRVP